MLAEVVKSFAGGYEGKKRYSIRKRTDGAFQIYHDNPWEGLEHLHPNVPEPLLGLFADVESAEAELFRSPDTRWGLTEVLYKDGNNP